MATKKTKLDQVSNITGKQERALANKGIAFVREADASVAQLGARIAALGVDLKLNDMACDNIADLMTQDKVKPDAKSFASLKGKYKVLLQGWRVRNKLEALISKANITTHETQVRDSLYRQARKAGWKLPTMAAVKATAKKYEKVAAPKTASIDDLIIALARAAYAAAKRSKHIREDFKDIQAMINATPQGRRLVWPEGFTGKSSPRYAKVAS